MSGETDHVRLLPWTGGDGRRCFLVSDGDGPVSRIADRVEATQLGLADRLLGRAREAIAEPGLPVGELGSLAAQLTEALQDALLIAECRGARLDAGLRTPDLLCEGLEVLPHVVGARGFALLTLPGRDRASARTARRRVRDTARAWGLLPGTVDDLETITGELVANALEHSDSQTVTVTCALTAGPVTISVTDEGTGYTRVAAAPATRPGPEQEHGRGLLITEALATRWGTRRTTGCLTVWAEVDTVTEGAVF